MKTLEIGDKILSRIDAENRDGVSQVAKAYAELIDEKGNSKIIWLVQGELQRGYTIQRNIVGGFVGTTEGKSPYFKGGGLVLSKNSPFGNALAELENGTGELSYKSENKTYTSVVEAKAEYQVNLNTLDGFQGTIYVLDEADFPFEDSLKERLKDLRALLETQKKAAVSEEEIQSLQIEIKALEDEIELKAKNARRYRRTTSSIRQKFMLDANQNKIKRQKLFSGPLIINGGPGTGKTTLLIHKIQYMLDPEVVNDETLTAKVSNEDWSFIRNQSTGWIFFSPTDLLKKYLEDAMTDEGLLANGETVKTWHQLRNSLKTSLGFFNPEKNRPFLAYNDRSVLWKLTAGQAKYLLDGFVTTLNEHFEKKISKLAKLKINQLSWGNKGLSIRAALGSIKEDTPISKLILTFSELSREFTELRLEIDQQYRTLNDRVASQVQRKLTEEETEWFKDLLKEMRNKKNDPVTEQESDEEEDEELIDAFEDEEVIDGRQLRIDINKLIKRVVRNDALNQLDSSVKISKHDKEILQKIDQYIDKSVYSELSSLGLFVRYFKPFLKGADSAILTALPRIYKTFRKTKIKAFDWLGADTSTRIEQIIESTPKNTRLHEDELDLIIWFALKLSRDFYLTSPDTYNASSHAYLKTYSAFMKGIVAVDEASDFTIVQLACMYNLCQPRLNTMILAGDMMQQMNASGINTWAEVQELLPSTDIAELNKSYRQTKRLLDLAIELYKNRFGTKPGFFASEPESEFDPPPIVHIGIDFEEKVNWIAMRILELYDIYDGIIPNIALFVKDNEAIQLFADALNDNTHLLGHHITVKPCLGEGEIGSSEFIRVFNINLIKGMEFESVFFIDVDDYESGDQEILDKLIYVGVSRATYYLAVTLKDKFPAVLEPIKDHFIAGDWSKNLDSDY